MGIVLNEASVVPSHGQECSDLSVHSGWHLFHYGPQIAFAGPYPILGHLMPKVFNLLSEERTLAWYQL